MKLVRNIGILAICAGWMAFGTQTVHAGPSDPCNDLCTWGESSCCKVNGTGWSCSGICNYCWEYAGDQTDTECTAEWQGQQAAGTICQCESPIK